MSALKPSEELQLSALAGALVYGVYQLNAPNLANVRASQPGTPNSQHVHGSVKTAAWTATVLLAGLAILGKSPTVFIVGGVVNAAEAWKYYHANSISPDTGKVPAGAGQQGM
jgi:hypothetical protein